MLLEIQTATEMIMNMKKSLKEESREMQKARSRDVENLRKKTEEFEKEIYSQSIRIVVLKEQSERFQLKLNVLAAQKIQLEEDINSLRQSSVGNKKIKLDPIASESSSADLGEEIRMKKHLLQEAKEKIPVMQAEENHLAARIRGMEEEMREGTRQLVKMRGDLESLVRGDVTRPSAIGVQLKSLIDKQQIRIKRVTWLEMKLAEINYKLNLDEIRREEERRIHHLMSDNME